MPEQNNDRLEQFFRKATSKPDVSFNEEDWKKLEARLDAYDAETGGVPKTGSKLISALAVSVILLFTAGLVINDHFRFVPSTRSVADENVAPNKDESHLGATPTIAENSEGERAQRDHRPHQANTVEDAGRVLITDEGSVVIDAEPSDRRPDAGLQTDGLTGDDASGPVNNGGNKIDAATNGVGSRSVIEAEGVVEIKNGQIRRDFMQAIPVLALKNKQKAIVELPGAEEVKTGEAESRVREEQVSDQSDQLTTPRLSLLLSFAPDFSGTSLSQYSSPGKAFGAMIHYHFWSRWSVSAGIIKNNKQYNGEGEDYQPPAGYWKYYTNGKIPSSIYGACDVLEFPLMVQYTILQNRKSKLLAGAGTSSYIMLNESYQYHFDEPNPGAREGWDSRSSSRFLLNMINLTVGYERQVFPRLMIGIEPYLKIPIEEIGWTNLKLFSTGAALTMRYTVLRKNSTVTSRSRGPD